MILFVIINRCEDSIQPASDPLRRLLDSYPSCIKSKYKDARYGARRFNDIADKPYLTFRGGVARLSKKFDVEG